MNRNEQLRAIERAIEGRRLVWFGTRGDDVESVMSIRGFDAVFSILSAHRQRRLADYESLERISRTRVDLDQYDLDEEPDADVFAEFRRKALKALAAPSVVFTYRPSSLVSSLCFARRGRARYLGMFKDHQSAFEHKPWVETSILELGIPTIPWHYVADEEQASSLEDLRNGPIMLRRSRSSGGTGLTRVVEADELLGAWPTQAEAYVSIAPYIDGGMPLNVSGVVWRDGVTLHPASLQLIGVPSCTARPFGYCGNDFAAIGELPSALLDDVETSTLTIGGWLGRHGYLGAFGVDYLVKDGVALFTEINPRFQGSTHLSCEIAVGMGESCLISDHLAALLGMSAPVSLRLRDFVASSPLSHVVVHSLADEPRSIDGSTLVERVSGPRLRRADVVCEPTVSAQSGATVARLTLDGSITTTGFDLDADLASAISTWQADHSTALAAGLHERVI